MWTNIECDKNIASNNCNNNNANHIQQKLEQWYISDAIKMQKKKKKRKKRRKNNNNHKSKNMRNHQKFADNFFPPKFAWVQHSAATGHHRQVVKRCGQRCGMKRGTRKTRTKSRQRQPTCMGQSAARQRRTTTTTTMLSAFRYIAENELKKPKCMKKVETTEWNWMRNTPRCATTPERSNM